MECPITIRSGFSIGFLIQVPVGMALRACVCFDVSATAKGNPGVVSIFSYLFGFHSLLINRGLAEFSAVVGRPCPSSSVRVPPARRDACRVTAGGVLGGVIGVRTLHLFSRFLSQTRSGFPWFRGWKHSGFGSPGMANSLQRATLRPSFRRTSDKNVGSESWIHRTLDSGRLIHNSPLSRFQFN
jgi:hypothetical protein